MATLQILRSHKLVEIATFRSSIERLHMRTSAGMRQLGNNRAACVFQDDIIEETDPV